MDFAIFTHRGHACILVISEDCSRLARAFPICNLTDKPLPRRGLETSLCITIFQCNGIEIKVENLSPRLSKNWRRNL